MNDRIPEVGEVWTSASTSVRWTVLAVLNDHYVWIQYTDYPPQTVTVAWMEGLVPPRKVSREIKLGRNSYTSNVYAGSSVYQTDTHIGTIVVYDDDTIEVKYATD